MTFVCSFDSSSRLSVSDVCVGVVGGRRGCFFWHVQCVDLVIAIALSHIRHS
jgi:hypothetical protein